jgi:hypothetical protein
LAVDVLEELPTSILFGPHGNAVVEVINVECALTEDIASRVASARHVAATAAYRRAWARWSAAERPEPVVAGALALFSNGKSASPVRSGFLVPDEAVWDSARLRGDAGAVTINDDGEHVLSEPWSTATTALLEAAMAFGAPELVDGSDIEALASAWRSVIGNDPASAQA